MYNRKSVGPRMEPWGTPTLTVYFCEDVPPEALYYWEKKKTRPHFSSRSIILLFINFSKTLLTTERRLTGQ